MGNNNTSQNVENWTQQSNGSRNGFDDCGGIDSLCDDNNTRALYFYNISNYEKAYELFSISSKSTQINGEMKVNIALCLYMLSRFQESHAVAVIATQSSFKSTANISKAFYRCGEALAKLSRFEESVAMFKKVFLYKNYCSKTDSRIAYAMTQLNARNQPMTRSSVIPSIGSQNSRNPNAQQVDNRNELSVNRLPTSTSTQSFVAQNYSQTDNRQSSGVLSAKSTSGKTVSPESNQRYNEMSVRPRVPTNASMNGDFSQLRNINAISQTNQLENVTNNMKNINLKQSDENMKRLNELKINNLKSTSQLSANQAMTKSYSTDKINNKGLNKNRYSKSHSKRYNSIENINKNHDFGSAALDEILSIDESVGIKVKTDEEGVSAYTKMINISRDDYRLFINRSYYNYRSGQYKFALNDAKTAIALKPEEPKAYVRAGLASEAMGNLNEAENYLVQVLSIIENNSFVSNQLVQIRCKALRDMKFDEKTSLNIALNTTSIQGAYKYLLTNKLKPENTEVVGKATNPLKLCSLNVRNVYHRTKLGDLYRIFGKFGKVEKIFFDRDYNCCFVNYLDSESPVDAINSLYGYTNFCENKNNPWFLGLVPNREQRSRFESMEKREMRRIINDCGECDDWRRNDCPLQDRCPLKHIPINKGIETLLGRRNKNH